LPVEIQTLAGAGLLFSKTEQSFRGNLAVLHASFEKSRNEHNIHIPKVVV
jgi:hypothetical protein